MSEFANGTQVLIERGGGIRGTVLESRPGQLRCELETGQTVWVPSSQVRGLDGSRPSYGPPGPTASSYPPYAPSSPPAPSFGARPLSANPYEAPRSFDESPAQPETLDWKWLLFSFDGRIPRSKYWLGHAVMFAALLVIAGSIGVLAATFSKGAHSSETPAFLILIIVTSLVFFVFFVWTSLAVSVKRWHDRGKSGWWVLIGIVPYIGSIWAFIENGCLPGDAHRNQYGDPTT